MSDKDEFIAARLKEETDKIQVDSYQKIASQGGWSGSGRTLWAISTVGAASGALVGLVAPFFPLLIPGVSSLGIAMAALPASVAAFSAAGLSFGFAGGMMLGRISGTASAVAQEQEKRLKSWTIEQILKENPSARIEHDKPAEEQAPKKPFWQRVKDNYYTYFNPRVGLAMTAIGIVGGLILGAAFVLTEGHAGTLMSALDKITGVDLAASAGAAIAYSAGVCGAIGALWHFNYPKITTATTHFFGELISGRMLGREWAPPQPAKEQTATPEREIFTPETPEPALATGAGISMRQFTSYTELVAHQPQESGPELAKR